ncbi:acyltransferase family protein [Hymenobacter seoulensis]
MSKPLHLTGLNGIRAIAALGVVVSHTTHELPAFNIDATVLGSYSKGLTLAGFGVSMFFCLSGFLITYLLLKEKEETHTVQFKKFYVRRALRIWPLYYLFFVACCAYYLSTEGSIPNASQLPFYILLAANVPFILGKVIPLVAHYWSLGVEEQFYLFWPFMAKLEKRTFLYMTIALAAVLVLAKVAIRFTNPHFDYSNSYRALHITRFHCMLFGAVASMWYNDNNKLFMLITQNIVTQLAAWFGLGLIILNKFHIASFVDNELVSLITIVLIIGQITKRNHIISLDNKFFDFIGKISYGIYVIHPLLIVLLAKLMMGLELDTYVKLLVAYGSVIGSTMLLAYLSYNYLEKPFLRIKHRYTVIHSQATITPQLLEDSPRQVAH